jgi:predicted nucleotidyltransferase
MLNLDPAHLKTIQAILKEHLSDCEVKAFGSRVTGTHKDYSDLDLVIIGPKKIERRLLIKLKDSFAESNLPFRVDILDWQRISPEFRKVIESQETVKIL